jgi:uncharacterized protein (TIGR02594 family)
MKLPTRYQWLHTINTLPRTITEALTHYGIVELPGAKNNATIMGWASELTAAGCNLSDYLGDSVPWCGLFCAYVTYKRRGNIKEVVSSPLWARSWANYGKPVQSPGLGDVLVFTRNGGGHVGFYVAEDKDCFHVLGGNQSNSVTITRIAKSRCIAFRRPIYIKTPASVKPYLVGASGTISENEA